MRIRFTLFLTTVLFLLPNMGRAQADHHHGSPETLGSVTFSTSCSSTIQPQFNRAVALMHSFQFRNAIEAFDTILVTDPSCSIAYWGIALSSWGNPFAAGLKSPAQLEQGLKAVKQARVSPPKTERERAYVEAVAHLYTDTANTDQQSRKLGYEDAMAALSAAHPEDNEAAIFYALAVAAAADPADKTYARQLKAGAILDKLFIQYPNHPGLAHYIIHAYDVPPLAAAGDWSRATLWRDCAFNTARIAHALPYIYPSRGLASVHRHQHSRRGRPHEARVRRPKSCTPPTTWSTPTCRPRRTMPRSVWWNRRSELYPLRSGISEHWSG